MLAKAFFPNSLQNKLIVFPKLFEQPRQEQLETLMHELGHIFGLRHYFAQISDRILPSVIFGGEHKAFSIMNYGNKSILTKEDKRDLKLLYQKAWNRELTSINNTPIYLVKPFIQLWGGHKGIHYKMDFLRVYQSILNRLFFL